MDCHVVLVISKGGGIQTLLWQRYLMNYDTIISDTFNLRLLLIID